MSFLETFSFVNKGKIFIICSSERVHHFVLSRAAITSSLNLYFIILAGTPPTIEYGGGYF